MAGVAALMAQDEDADVTVLVPVDDGVGESNQWERLPPIGAGCADARELLRQPGNALELIQEAPCQSSASFGVIPARRLLQVIGSKAVDRPGHDNSARKSVSTSSSGKNRLGSC